MRSDPVKEWIMPLDEFYAKYGFFPPGHPDLNDGKVVRQGKAQQQGEKNWNWSKITKEKYQILKDSGKSDAEIIESHKWLNYSKLHKLKTQWGMIS